MNNGTPVYCPECSGILGGGVDISLNQLWLQIPDSNELVQFIDPFIAVFLLQDSLYGGHSLFSLLSSSPLALGYVYSRQRRGAN